MGSKLYDYTIFRMRFTKMYFCFILYGIAILRPSNFIYSVIHIMFQVIGVIYNFQDLHCNSHCNQGYKLQVLVCFLAVYRVILNYDNITYMLCEVLLWLHIAYYP